MPGLYVTDDPLLEELAHSPWSHVPQTEIPHNWRELRPPPPVADEPLTPQERQALNYRNFLNKGNNRERQLEYVRQWRAKQKFAKPKIDLTRTGEDPSRARRRAEKEEDMRIRMLEQSNFERLLERERRAS